MNKPLISVITVVFNSERFIESTIKSVISQDHRVEYIVVDGCSEDSTLSIIGKYKKKIDLIISEKDNGIYEAMNKGIDRSNGEWLIFMNAGDLFYDERVISSIVSNLKNSENDIVYGDSIDFDKGIEYHKKSRKPFWIYYGMFCRHQAIFFRRQKDVFYDTKYKFAGDYALIAKLWSNNKKFEKIDLKICRFLLGGLSFDNAKLSRIESNRVKKDTLNMNPFFIFLFDLLQKLTFFRRKKNIFFR